MTPVIQAHPGGLFCEYWKPVPQGLAYHSYVQWFDAKARVIPLEEVMRTTQVVEVEADLSLEVWSQQWLIEGNDVMCRMCQRRQRLVCAHEAFAHRRACMWNVLQKKHYPWQALASILRPFDWEH